MQCRAEIPQIKKTIPEFAGKPVTFLSINTRDPKGQVNAEVKRYKITYPAYYGRGHRVNEQFKVLKLPRLIIIKPDCTIYRDVLFYKADKLKAELDKLLEEVGESAVPDTATEGVKEIKG